MLTEKLGVIIGVARALTFALWMPEAKALLCVARHPT